MENQYIVKPLNINDLSIIENLFTDVFTNEPWNDDWTNNEQLQKYLKDVIDNKNSLSIGLFNKDELVGISLGSVIHWYSGTEFCIKRINQHQGLGTIFLKLVENYLNQNEILSIILSTDIDTPAYNFYKKNAFNELSKTRFFHKKVH